MVLSAHRTGREARHRHRAEGQGPGPRAKDPGRGPRTIQRTRKHAIGKHIYKQHTRARKHARSASTHAPPPPLSRPLVSFASLRSRGAHALPTHAIPTNANEGPARRVLVPSRASGRQASRAVDVAGRAWLEQHRHGQSSPCKEAGELNADGGDVISIVALLISLQRGRGAGRRWR